MGRSEHAVRQAGMVQRRQGNYALTGRHPLAPRGDGGGVRAARDSGYQGRSEVRCAGRRQRPTGCPLTSVTGTRRASCVREGLRTLAAARDTAEISRTAAIGALRADTDHFGRPAPGTAGRRRSPAQTVAGSRTGGPRTVPGVDLGVNYPLPRCLRIEPRLLAHRARVSYRCELMRGPPSVKEPLTLSIHIAQSPATSTTKPRDGRCYRAVPRRPRLRVRIPKRDDAHR